jgi:hypothetical protein
MKTLRCASCVSHGRVLLPVAVAVLFLVFRPSAGRPSLICVRLCAFLFLSVFLSVPCASFGCPAMMPYLCGTFRLSSCDRGKVLSADNKQTLARWNSWRATSVQPSPQPRELENSLLLPLSSSFALSGFRCQGSRRGRAQQQTPQRQPRVSACPESRITPSCMTKIEFVTTTRRLHSLSPLQ